MSDIATGKTFPLLLLSHTRRREESATCDRSFGSGRGAISPSPPQKHFPRIIEVEVVVLLPFFAPPRRPRLGSKEEEAPAPSAVPSVPPSHVISQKSFSSSSPLAQKRDPPSTLSLSGNGPPPPPSAANFWAHTHEGGREGDFCSSPLLLLLIFPLRRFSVSVFFSGYCALPPPLLSPLRFVRGPSSSSARPEIAMI